MIRLVELVYAIPPPHLLSALGTKNTCFTAWVWQVIWRAPGQQGGGFDSVSTDTSMTYLDYIALYYAMNLQTTSTRLQTSSTLWTPFFYARKPGLAFEFDCVCDGVDFNLRAWKHLEPLKGGLTGGFWGSGGSLPPMTPEIPEILHQLIDGPMMFSMIYGVSTCFDHPRWCRISQPSTVWLGFRPSSTSLVWELLMLVDP